MAKNEPQNPRTAGQLIKALKKYPKSTPICGLFFKTTMADDLTQTQATVALCCHLGYDEEGNAALSVVFAEPVQDVEPVQEPAQKLITN